MANEQDFGARVSLDSRNSWGEAPIHLLPARGVSDISGSPSATKASDSRRADFNANDQNANSVGGFSEKTRLLDSTVSFSPNSDINSFSFSPNRDIDSRRYQDGQNSSAFSSTYNNESVREFSSVPRIEAREARPKSEVSDSFPIARESRFRTSVKDDATNPQGIFSDDTKQLGMNARSENSLGQDPKLFGTNPSNQSLYGSTSGIDLRRYGADGNSSNSYSPNFGDESRRLDMGTLNSRTYIPSATASTARPPPWAPQGETFLSGRYPEQVDAISARSQDSALNSHRSITQLQDQMDTFLKRAEMSPTPASRELPMQQGHPNFDNGPIASQRPQPLPPDLSRFRFSPAHEQVSTASEQSDPVMRESGHKPSPIPLTLQKRDKDESGFMMWCVRACS